MRLISEEFKGVTCIHKPLRIGYEALGPGLICFVGKNGSGKTTSAEIPAAALWQVFPSRPDFYERFHGRDAYAEVEFEDRDHRYTARIHVDVEKRATERYLFLDGQPVTSKAADFKAAVKEHFGSLDAFLVGPFAAQNRRGNFLEKSPADRKKIIAEMLGLQRWDAKHELAKKRRTAAELQLEKARGSAEAIERELMSTGTDRRVTLRLELAGFEAARRQLDNELVELREAETSRRQDLAAARAKENEISSLEQVYRSTQAEYQTLAAQVRAAEDRVSTHKRESQRRIAELRKLLDATGEQKIRDGIANRRLSLERRKAGCRTRLNGEEAIGRAETDLAHLIEEHRLLDQAQEQLRSLEADLGRTETNLRAAQRALPTAEASRKREIESLNHRAQLLDRASCNEAEMWEDPERQIQRPLMSICPLLADAQRATQSRIDLEAAELPERAEVSNAETVHRAVRSAYDAARSEAANLDCRIRKNEQAQTAARNQIAQQAIIDDARKQIEAIDHELKSLDFELDLALESFRSSQDVITGQIAEAVKVAATTADALEGEISGLRRQADAAADRLTQAKAVLDAARQTVFDVAEMERRLSVSIQQREAIESQIRETEREHAAAATRLEILEAWAAELEQIKAQIEQINQRLSDLKLIELATGRNGVQILEISAAGPGISRKINELLEACYGTRFSVRFETLREKVSSPGEFAEDFDIKISDNGREDSAAGLSGGEQVWIAAAISLGINIYNAERSPVRWETLWLDETAGALDTENARAYVNMLRRARELGGFHQILFVGHSPEIQSMADACLYFSNGQVSFENDAIAA